VSWPEVAMVLGVGGLALGFYALRVSAAGRAASMAALEQRLLKLEQAPLSEPVPVMPRGLPRRLP
jgi:hypothetical protein